MYHLVSLDKNGSHWHEGFYDTKQEALDAAEKLNKPFEIRVGGYVI